jgi:preprotein translocase SecE subunit
MDNRKYIVMSFLGASAALGIALRGLAVPLLARLDVGDPQIAGVIDTTSLVGLLAATIAFVVLNRHLVAVNFTDEVISELRKVSWPDKEETLRSTAVVIGFSIALAVSLASYDFIWLRLTRVLLATGS